MFIMYAVSFNLCLQRTSKEGTWKAADSLESLSDLPLYDLSGCWSCNISQDSLWIGVGTFSIFCVSVPWMDCSRGSRSCLQSGLCFWIHETLRLEGSSYRMGYVFNSFLFF